MSIPKEPRALMVQLMYVVLTAMLALNVSAEIMNAFFEMDKSLNESSKMVENSNEQLRTAINDQATAYTQFEPYLEKVAQTQAISAKLYEAVASLKDELIEGAGGLTEEGLPLRKRDKDITTRLMINEGKGAEIESLITNTRLELLQLIEDEVVRLQMEESIPLKIRELPADTDKKNWAEFTFKQMPVAAVLPTLSKFQNDVKVTETAILNYFMGLTNTSFKPDAFAPVVAADKNYVIRGEDFSAEIFLSAFSSTANNISISVDGKPLRVEGGKAIFNYNPSRTGKKQHVAKVNFTNPITGEEETYEKRFDFEVGERSVTVAAEKMNVFYVGVENPLAISAAGVPSNQMTVNATGVRVNKLSNGKYMVKPKRVGDATITVSGGGLEPTSFAYRVKKIPDPTIYLGRKRGGNIKLAEFKANQGIVPILENFDFKAKCKIDGFEMARVRKGEVADAQNQGGKYQNKAQSLVSNAKRNDIFYFDKIRVRCPGDETGRNMGGMVFKIK